MSDRKPEKGDLGCLETEFRSGYKHTFSHYRLERLRRVGKNR